MKRGAAGALAAVGAAVALLALLPGLLPGLLPAGPTAPPGPGRVDQPAPGFHLPNLHDSAHSLSPVQMRGRVWVLHVWASWCGPCRDEHPLLVSLAREGQVPLLGLNYKDDPRSAQEWLMRLGDPYLATALDRLGSTGKDYGLPGVPASFVIDRHGVVRHRHLGPLSRELWDTQLLPLVRRLQDGA